MLDPSWAMLDPSQAMLDPSKAMLDSSRSRQTIAESAKSYEAAWKRCVGTLAWEFELTGVCSFQVS